MTKRLRKASLAAAALVQCCWLAPAAGAQSLTLSYALDVDSPTSQPAPTVNRCSGLHWVSSIGACGRDLLTRFSASRVDEMPRAAEGPPVFEAAVPELPLFNLPAAERLLRRGGGKDSLMGNAKPVDVLLRLGSKYRLRSTEGDGWEWYRFNDVTAEVRKGESWMQKAVGVEFVVPFK